MTRTSVPQTHRPRTGWNDWREVSRHHSPYRHHLVEAWRREWQTVEVLRIADLPPEFNVAGLYWRSLQSPTPEPAVAMRLAANSGTVATRTARTHNKA
jgi:hypothetical protein